jgi:stage II sporulation protein D
MRFVSRLGVIGVLLLGGLVSGFLAAQRGRAGGSTTATTATGGAATTVLTSTAPSVLVVSGHGWGHGLGLSQWGANGYARHGWTYDRILAHYYSGTTLGAAKVATLRVLLAQARKASLSSLVAWRVTDSAGVKAQLDPGELILRPKLAIVGHPALQPPFTFVGKQPLIVNGKPYRGKIVVSSDGKRLEVLDTVGVEAYLKGVVPSEMPSDWPPEALKAQAVAARSYALANLTKGRGFDLYSDTRDQVYGGVDAEASSASDAVDATKGEVVLYHGKVADTLFSSTSGGRTASSLDATGVAVPYLVSVSDPFDTASPYHDWGPVLFDGAKVAKQLKLAAPLAALQTTTGPSGRVKTVTAVSADESQVTLTAARLRAELDLRSTWFTPAVLALRPSVATMTYGGAVSLTGFAHGADAVSIESKAAGFDWASAGELILDANGAFSTIVRPAAATQYRLAWGDLRVGLARISVAPRVDAQATAAGAQGSIKPVASGASVQLQRQLGAGWTTVTSTLTDATGAWSFTGPLSPATYRIRVVAGHGLSPGVSPPLLVQ